MVIKLIKHNINLLRNKLRDVGIGEKRSGKWETLEKHFLEAHPHCEICGSKKHLNVHHMQPFHLHPELELDENNLITLCMDKHECHLKIGHGGSFRAYNPNVKKDVEILKKDISKFEEIAGVALKNRKLH